MPTSKHAPVKVTKAYIDKIRPPAESYEHHWDATVKGYGLRVNASGKRVFIATGRVKGKQVSVTLGPYGELTEVEAREKARRVLQQMREGIDPRQARKAEASLGVTLKEVCDAYVTRPGKLKASSRSEIERHVATTFEAWKDRPIAFITQDMCKARYREMLTKGLRGKKGAPGQANQAFAILGALLGYAGRQHRRADGSPLCDRGPVNALKDDRVKLKPRTSRILDHKVGAVWLELRQWRAVAHNRDTMSSIDLVRLLILTGLRISEAASLTWDRVKLADGYFTLPDPKNRNPVSLPLSSQAVELLKARPRVTGNPHVFPSWGKKGHIVSPRDVMKKVSAIAGSSISPHALRRTWTNISLRCVRNEKFATDLLSNHLTRDVTTEHYFDTTNLQWLAPQAQKIGDYFDQQALIAAGENVTRLIPRTEAA